MLSTAKSLARLLCVGWLALVSGCQTLHSTETKARAKERWSRVRASVKLQLATQQYEAGFVEEAAQAVAEAIALDPKQADGYALLARANLERGKPASAQQTLAMARRLGVNAAELDYLQGVIDEQRGALEDALARYTAARRQDPANVDYLVAQAECLVSLDRTAEAFELVLKNADRFDDAGTVATLTAHIALLNGDTDRASREYARALAACPDSRLVAVELGRLLFESNRFEEARMVLEPLMDESDQAAVPSGVRRTLAGCYLALGDAAAAHRTLVDYAPDHPDDTVALLILAKSAIAIGDVVTALRAVDLVEQREPDRPELWLVRATLRWKRGRLAAAAGDLLDVLQNNPNDVEAHCLLAEVFRDQQRLDAARREFETALKIDPSCAWAAAGLKALAQLPPPDEPPPARLTSAETPSK